MSIFEELLGVEPAESIENRWIDDLIAGRLWAATSVLQTTNAGALISIWNPPDSRRACAVKAIVASVDTSAPISILLSFLDSPVGAVAPRDDRGVPGSNTWQNLRPDLGRRGDLLEIRQSTITAAPYPGQAFFHTFVANLAPLQIVALPWVTILQPGRGVLAATGVASLTLVITWIVRPLSGRLPD